MPVCTKCKKEKERDKFRERESAKNGLQYWCRDCENKANRDRYEPKPKKPKKQKGQQKSKEEIKRERKDRMLKHRYGISLEEYKSMYKEQDERCAICKEEYELGGYGGLYVDHNHKTENVRGLLCPRCNSLLGKFLEDKKLLKRAVKYLNNN